MNFDIDATNLFPLAYSGKCAKSAVELFSGKDYSTQNQAIGTSLNQLIPPHYHNISWNLERGSNFLDDEMMCVKEIALQKLFPIRLYDFGAVGTRPLDIIYQFNASLSDKDKHFIPNITGICLSDISPEIIRQAIDTYYGTGINIGCLHVSDFKDIMVPPIYQETDRDIQQQSVDGSLIDGGRYKANCITNLEKRIFALLGRTINNVDNPVRFLEKAFFQNMSPLDILVIESRHSSADIKGYEDSIPMFREHLLRNIGLSEEHIKDDAIKIEEEDKTIYAYVILSSDFTDDKGIISRKGQKHKKGTKILLAKNKPIDHAFELTREIERDDTEICFSTMKQERVGDDTIFYLRKDY